LAATAKKGRPIETPNKPISQNAAWSAGGLPQPAAIDSGNAVSANAKTQRCTITARRGSRKRVIAYA
jgi:hypothetical protein